MAALRRVTTMPKRQLALIGGGVVAAVLLTTAGLAALGVDLPGFADDPFEAAGIELPNQSPSPDDPAVIGSTQRGHANQQDKGTRDQDTNSSGDQNSSPSTSVGSPREQQSAAKQANRRHHSPAGPAKGDHHRILHGVSDTTNNKDFHRFAKRVGAHPAVLQDFYHWGTPLTTGALERWHQTGTRGMLSLSTAPGRGPELISPRQIAQGSDDHYLVRLNQSIAASGQVVYLRLFPEMNGYWNPYCGYDITGRKKGQSHSSHNLIRAWQRAVLIIRGGKRKAINRKLRERHMPRILRASSNHDPIYRPENVQRRLPHPRVAFIWTPQATGSPNVPGNQPGAYWPGKRFVDWVGTDVYSAYARPLPKLKSFYRHWRGYPFVIGEYSPWDKDRSGRFTRKLFHWAERHRRVGMLIYYRSVYAGSPYDVTHWPKALRVMRHELNKRHFAPFAPGTRGR
jgi:hypothetical protein